MAVVGASSTHSASTTRSSTDSQRTMNETKLGKEVAVDRTTHTATTDVDDKDIEKQFPAREADSSVAVTGTLDGDPEKNLDLNKITTALDWTGPNDPENPMNWSSAVKWYHVMVVGMQSFTVSFGTSVYSPAVEQVSRVFGVSRTAAIVPLSVYVLGLAFGPMLAAPISETWGRRQIYRVLFPISLLFSLGASLAQSFGTLVACRLLAGLLGSGALAVGGGTTSDMFVPAKRAAGGAVFILWPFLGPAFGPCIGSFTAQYRSWRWPLYTILMLGAVASLLAMPMRETHKRIILERRAKRLGLPPPVNPLPSELKARIKVIVLVTLLRPMRMLLTEPIVAFLSIYTAFNFAVLFGFFAAFPVIFRSPFPEVQVYHFSLGVSGLVFLAIALGCLIATFLFIWMDHRVYQSKLRAASSDTSAVKFAPEERMPPAMIGAVLMPVSMFWFAWTARSSIHWIVPVIATVFFGIGNLLIFDSTILYLIDTYGAKESASASAANGLLRYTAGAVFPLFMVQFVRAVGVGWSISVFGFVTLLLCPIPWILHRWGPKIRQRSAYTRS